MISGLQGKRPSVDVFYFKGETIRIINRRLSDKKQMATDPMIGSVASLAHLEVRLKFPFVSYWSLSFVCPYFSIVDCILVLD